MVFTTSGAGQSSVALRPRVGFHRRAEIGGEGVRAVLRAIEQPNFTRARVDQAGDYCTRAATRANHRGSPGVSLPMRRRRMQ